MLKGSGVDGSEKRLRQFLKSRFPRFSDKVGLDDPLDRIVDSLGLFDLVEWVEKSWAIRVPNEEFSPRRFATLRDILATIQEFEHR